MTLPMDMTRTAADFLASRINLSSLRRAATACKGCHLYKGATQTVFGEGRRSASLMLVGKIPGNDEDLAGRPFVGPAGGLLQAGLDEAGIRRRDVYVTNAVKHFKWRSRGKRRLHEKPNRTEVVSCRAWLESEIAVIRPSVIVALGATASQALLGWNFRLTKHRAVDKLSTPWRAHLLATWHPAAILRAPTREARVALRKSFVEDLRYAATQLR